ncbi:dephospho-CoA kinase [Enterococcus dispar]|uniref:Dephospho-CoA kinase n=1 Tax=Enterococcus dispar ATCC 51266 TaxID=1139219 RepID=S0KVJ6_9ENTE|nr:dephospho-CoA kinase [Enterococcus dispar]EOT43226.1 dephospho-CoA kinase [Enterococcus dispar ATCC 51266]EOW85326.1 dephospho-CoA kinase [Enterococcus dispar ATCC 51266]MCU7358464.1 dephospho-CoA kinase [Enterococcus dispar]MDT2706625.1 dephospho-CoA kinase [Enterococcus dispar]OJG40215.1 dephospho-CoA kinase [Enterococcus dispar]
MSFILGITGGIASGKSTVVNVFKAKGFPIVDGDIVARKIVEPGKPALLAIKEAFGPEVITPTGELDRKKLGDIVFEDSAKRQQLNRIMNPYLRQQIKEEMALAKKQSPLVIADIPLMYEGHYDHYMDEVAVVYVDFLQQKKRLMARDNIDEKMAEAKINSQMPLAKKRELADTVFNNNGSKEETSQQVLNWLENHFRIEK